MTTREQGGEPMLDGLPAFFTNGSVDDTKYESLLEDLRAHDLLGPAESSNRDDASRFGGSSLFFNDAFSAVFMGNFSDSKPPSTTAVPAPASSSAKPPPGFTRAPPGLAPTETDLKWARGQQAFSQQYQTTTSATVLSPVRGDDELLDESQIPSLRALGLDDDDSASPVKRAPAPSAPPPPPPSAMPPPPGAWQHSQARGHPLAHQPPLPGQHAVPQPPQPSHGHHSHPMHPPPPPQYAPHPMAPPPHHHHHPPHPHHPHMPPPPPPPPMHMHMRGPPPPPPGAMPFPPGPYGGGPPPVMMAPPTPRFKMMTPRDITFVVQQQMKQIRSSDPFSDDYYFHNYNQKRARVPTARPGGAALPLPSWKLEHVKSIDAQDSSRAAKSREWENEHQVLGRNNQRSLYRPKQLLVLAKEDEPATPKEVVITAKKEGVFGSDLWDKRHQIDRGFQSLLSLQDARHLLDARGINVQQFHSIDEENMDPALAELRARTTQLLLELAGLLGVSVAQNPHDVACDLEQLHRMLSVAKGKRLVSRALPLLHPSARFVLLPHLIEYLLSAASVGKTSSDTTEDERLSQAIVLMLLYHPPVPSAELLTECLIRAMQGHDMQTLRVLLYNRGRAEALQALLQRGGAVVADSVDDQLKAKWNHEQETFVALATAIKQTS